MCEQVLQKTHFAETVVSRIVSKLGKDALVRQLRTYTLPISAILWPMQL